MVFLLLCRKWRDQNGRKLLRFGLLLHFDFAEEQARTAGGDGRRSGFRAARAVEGRLIVGGQDLVEHGERRADQVHAAHQFFATVEIDAIDMMGITSNEFGPARPKEVKPPAMSSK